MSPKKIVEHFDAYAEISRLPAERRRRSARNDKVRCTRVPGRKHRFSKNSTATFHEMYLPMMAARRFFVELGTTLGSVMSA